jgi:hypothetical protein
VSRALPLVLLTVLAALAAGCGAQRTPVPDSIELAEPEPQA